MFKKNAIAPGNISSYLNGFDRIFIHESMLRGPDALTFVGRLIALLGKKQLIILNLPAAEADPSLIAMLENAGLLRHNSRGQIVKVSTTYYRAAIEIAANNKNNYKLLLITNDETSGNEFVRLDYEDNHVNGLGACGFRSDGTFFEYGYDPPFEPIKFIIRPKSSVVELGIMFFRPNNVPLYPENDAKIYARAVGAEFVYEINKAELYDSLTLKFLVREKHGGTVIRSADLDFKLEREQRWELSVVASSVSARIITTPTPTPAPKPTPTTTPPPPKPRSNAAIDETVPESEKYPYYGGTGGVKVTLPVDKKLAPSVLPTEGSTVKTGKGKTVKLVRELGAGGEGVVYSTDDKSIVCKVLNNKVGTNLTVNKQQKIELMTKNPPKNPQIVWPIDPVYTTDGVFVGYTMRSIHGKELCELVARQRPTGNNTYNVPFGVFNMTRTQIVEMILSILDTIIYLHHRNIIVGDIRMENFMILNNDTSKVFFVDCDSYQVGKFPATKVTNGYIPPELLELKDPQGNPLPVNEVYRTFGNEDYALFSLLFMILHKAVKPYEQIGSDISEEARARLGVFPYFLDAEKTEKHARKGYPPANWSHLPGYIKRAFISVGYAKGQRFGPNKRLSAEDWYKLFSAYLRDLKSGKLKGMDPDCDKGIHDPGKLIDYSRVDYKETETVVKLFRDTSLSSILRAVASETKQSFSTGTAASIAAALRSSVGAYKSEDVKMVIKKNIGCYYEVECTYNT